MSLQAGLLSISTGICTKVETRRVHTGFPCCFLSVDLRHYCLVTCMIERRKYNQMPSRTRAELWKKSKLKRERKSFWVLQRKKERKTGQSFEKIKAKIERIIQWKSEKGTYSP